MQSALDLPTQTSAQVRDMLLQRQEIALLDVREEAAFALGHPLWAANLSLARIEVDAWRRIPRRDTCIVVYDNGEGLAAKAAQILGTLGYRQVYLLHGGLQGWRNAGYQLFIDVNVPSKAFGEWLEAERHTPSLTAEEVKALLDARANIVVLDARRWDEYQTMSIPGGISVPGAELVLRAQALAPDASTHIVVNCAGRTRSLIGTQSLINAGLPNRITALRNGTIGWLLAGQQLAHGASQRASSLGQVSAQQVLQAANRARAVADRAGVGRAKMTDLQRFAKETQRTTYRFDVRTAEEYATGHLSGFGHYAGGQLVQETDHAAPVRGARIVLTDDDGVRANMSASWLAQMGWEVWVLDGVDAAHFNETGSASAHYPPAPTGTQFITPQELGQKLHASGASTEGTVVLHVGSSASYAQQHIPGSWFVLRSQLAQALSKAAPAEHYVLTCSTGLMASYAAQEVQCLTGKPVHVLQGGTQAWQAQGLPLQPALAGEPHWASPRADRYQRPYEGVDAPREAMQAYLDWEFGLVQQLHDDGTHGFQVI